jgi:hypothetical protein
LIRSVFALLLVSQEVNDLLIVDRRSFLVSGGPMALRLLSVLMHDLLLSKQVQVLVLDAGALYFGHQVFFLVLIGHQNSWIYLFLIAIVLFLLRVISLLYLMNHLLLFRVDFHT